MSTTGGGPDYAGCRLIVSESGRSGFAVGVEGERAGGLFSLFVSPTEPEGTADRLIAMALELGARWLITYGDPILDHWFARFGFRAVSAIPKEATPAGDTDIVYMIHSGVTPSEPSPSIDRPCRPHERCARCGAQVTQEVRAHELVGGYACGSCRHVSVYGTLTLEPRKHRFEPVPETTRVTWAVYADDNAQQTLEVPGWVGAMSHLRDHFQRNDIEVRAVVGQIFVERPYCTLADAPDQITSVEMSSRDGHKSMIQELVGHIKDANEIRRVVAHRLGPEVANWDFNMVSYMVRGKHA